MNSMVIYTDLDGSLLDHYNYSHAAVDALLEDLETLGIPVIPTSSKTFHSTTSRRACRECP